MLICGGVDLFVIRIIMRTTKLTLKSDDCYIEVTHYESITNEVSLCYLERQADYYYSDEEVSIDIDKEKGREIIAFLTKHLSL